VGSSPAAAQASSGSDAGIFLLLPVGAEAVGMGEAVVAVEGGSESVWWNPAALAAQTKHELAIHDGRTSAGTADVLSFVVPSKRGGSIAVSLNIFNPGEQQVTDPQNQPVGVILPRDIVFAGTYAIAIARRLNVGFSYKVIQFRVDCTGQCATVGTFVNSSNAADAGAQYKPSPSSPLALGLAVRNFGGKVKSGSSDTRDALPTQTDAGFLYHVTYLDKYLKDTEVRAAGSVVSTRDVAGLSYRVGADMVYQSNVHLRAGYVIGDHNSDSSKSLGFGIQSGRLVFDFAKLFGGASADLGTQPTYLSLRFLF